MKLKQKRFCINSCNSVVSTRWLLHKRIGEEYELKIDKAPQNVDSALTQGPEMARVRELMYWNSITPRVASGPIW